MDQKTFLTYERKVAKLIVNSRKTNRLSSAYLLYGQRNAPLKECALFIAKSLGCEKDLLACDQCDSCMRFEKGIHPDFILISGENQTIKKEDIQNLTAKFSLSAFEKNHRLCYVIHQVENITTQAANNILKFLEEPKEGQVAILTTYNLDRVLPTIRSRAIPLRIDPINPNALMEELESHPLSLFDLHSQKKKKKEDIYLSHGECYFLSQFFATKESAEEAVTSNDNFREGYLAAETILNALCISNEEASYTLLRQAGQKKGSACYNWMYSILHEVFAATLIGENSENHPFHDVISHLEEHKDAIKRTDDVIKEALAFRLVNFNPILMAGRVAAALEGD